MPDSATLAPGPQGPRFSEPAKWVPVAFAWANIVALWVVYMFFHCVPLLANKATSDEAIPQIVIFNVLTFLIIICYIRAIATHPGTIPTKFEGDSTWEYVPAAGSRTQQPDALGLGLQETKRSGDRRHCKWCAKYKPDRCHHCRVCRQCILKMDHHCPWIYNCVGFANHKYFFLLIFYSSIATNMIVWTMATTVTNSVEKQKPFAEVFFLIFGQSLAAFLGLIVTAFFLFHVWLMLKNMTTIEFCEKSMKQTGYGQSNYDLGCCGNIRAVLGDNPLTWLLPVDPPSGTGLNFTNEETPIARDMEAGRGISEKPARQKRRKQDKRAGTGEYAPSESSYPDSASSIRTMSEQVLASAEQVLFKG